jgi:hypothetical protein
MIEGLLQITKNFFNIDQSSDLMPRLDKSTKNDFQKLLFSGLILRIELIVICNRYEIRYAAQLSIKLVLWLFSMLD